MDLAFTAACAALLLVERLAYWFVWTRPAHFQAWLCRHPQWLGSDPVLGLRSLFYGFKITQIAVLMGWCIWFGGALLPWPSAPVEIIGIGVLLILSGQILNLSVMFKLGSEGVFYGNRFGRRIEWQTGFPFSLLPHPQYLGALMSVWGFMLLMRFPNPDWIVLPLISTLYYALGARLER